MVFSFIEFPFPIPKVCLCLMLVAGPAGGAAVASAGPPLTWPVCVETAGRHNPELRAARETLRASEHQARGASSGYFPQLTASAGRTENRVAGLDTAQNNATLTATQNLFAGFRDSSSAAQATASRDAAAESLNQIKARVSFDLKSAYAQLRYAQDNLVLARDIARRRDENQRLVQLRFESGRENKGSFFLARASHGQARLEHTQAGHAVEVARVQLARVLGVDAQDWEPADRVPVQSPEANPDFERLIAGTPEVRQALAQETAAHAGIGIARAGLLPSLNLSGSVGRQGEEWTPAESTRSVGLTLSVPLYSGGKDYHATNSAVAGYAAAQASRENTERQARARLKQAYRNYQQAMEKLKVDGDFVEAAVLRAEIARSKYNNGLLSFEDWDIIENDLIGRQKALLVSVRERVTAEAGWEQAKGEGVIP